MNCPLSIITLENRMDMSHYLSCVIVKFPFMLKNWESHVVSVAVSFAYRLLCRVILDWWEAILSGCKIHSFCLFRFLVFFVVRVRSCALPCCRENVTMTTTLAIILKHWYVFFVLQVSLGTLSLPVPPGTLHCLRGIFYYLFVFFILFCFGKLTIIWTMN